MFKSIKNLVKKTIAKIRSFKVVKVFLAVTVVGVPLVCTYAAVKVFFAMIVGHAALIPLAAIWLVLVVISGFMFATRLCETYKISTILLTCMVRCVTGILAFAFTMPIVIPVAIAIAGWATTIYIVTKLV